MPSPPTHTHATAFTGAAEAFFASCLYCHHLDHHPVISIASFFTITTFGALYANTKEGLFGFGDVMYQHECHLGVIAGGADDDVVKQTLPSPLSSEPLRFNAKKLVCVIHTD